MSTALITINKGDLRNRAGIANYTKHWEKDLSKETAEDAQARKDVYAEVVNGYYDGATELYEMGWAESFHFARYYKGEAFHQALARHEHYLAAQMNLKPGMRVLDVGCGVGGPAREIARFADVEIVGANNNAFQIGRAQKYTARAGLSDKVTFVKGDFMALAEQFGENSFDAVYAIEATCHAPDWERCYNEIRKVLKPGGTFGVYEWCMTDCWDAKNSEHVRVQKQVELGNGIPEMRTISACRTALQNVGFEILHEEDLADRPDDIKWYYPLEGDLRKCQTLWDVITCWRMTRVGKFCTQNTVWGLEKIGLVPKGTYDVGEALKTAAVGLVEGGQKKLFTPMMLFVCKKPEAELN
ncbi:delta-sterol C-methyltransferase [Leucosporidium creatinivorum]|uniref:Delta-sterol C-methyltransferase n=1 Tax=Leucosporidium creatinivorum TaxID=106004 RepID=A0A1Y2FXY1_9BASI|nr:delta-sterol C-methyltransferase [Leucosporidium creatinivorum]